MLTPEKIHQSINELQALRTKAIQDETMRNQLLKRRDEIITTLNGMGFKSTNPEDMIKELEQNAEQIYKEISELIPNV